MTDVRYATHDDAARTGAFFADRPAGFALWESLASEAAGWGPITATATETRVCLLGRTRFLYCPKAHADGHIFIRFLLPRRLEDPRVQSVRDDGGRWSHRVKIAQLDDEVLGWFQEAAAYDLAGADLMRTG